MNKKMISGSVLGLAVFALGIGAAIAAHHEGEERIAHARAAAPAAVSDDATIVVDGEVEAFGEPHVGAADANARPGCGAERSRSRAQ